MMVQGVDEHANEQDATQRATEPAVRRRGLIAGAAMLAAGLLAKQASEPVAANTGDPMILGQANTASSTTSLSTFISGVGGVAFSVTTTTNNGTAIQGAGGETFGTGVVGTSPMGFGVTGTGQNGVVGTTNSPNGVGVSGDGGSTSVGVIGTGAIGVWGQTPALDNSSLNGVLGSATNGTGVAGLSTNHVAVYGYSGSNAVGVQGQSTNSHGLVGFTDATDGHAGLIGYANQAGGIGVIGNAPGGASPGLAGVFNGDVTINGAFRVYGAPKNAAVKHPTDNTYRLLYCEESPESWFADYGRGTLAGDKADITLDPDFAALVHTEEYHVFLTAHGPQHLHVAQQSATGFTVVATPLGGVQAGGPKAVTGGGTFSWRVVAKRKDIAGDRLAKVDAPPRTQPAKALPVPQLPKVEPPPKKP